MMVHIFRSLSDEDLPNRLLEFFFEHLILFFDHLHLYNHLNFN